MANKAQGHPWRDYFISAFQIGIFWGIIGTLQMLYEYNVLVNYKVLPDNYSLAIVFQSVVIPIFMAGLVVGFFLTHRINRWLRKYPYGKALLFVLLSFSALYLFINIVAAMLYNMMYFEAGVEADIVWSNVREYLTGWENFKNYVFWSSINLMTILGLQINDKYGPGNFRSFLLGKYFHPKREERIVMFLDLRDSTIIAEQLDELAYFEFVKHFFKDATDGILHNKGEIEQYIGDEILIGWTIENGLENNHCIQCFFDIKKSIAERAHLYEATFGFIPDFKAGLHIGSVVTGEIGVIKKDISYSGDVLNTGSRIQSQCNALGVDLLLSDALAQQLDWSAGWKKRQMGSFELRGKRAPILLWTVDEEPS